MICPVCDHDVHPFQEFDGGSEHMGRGASMLVNKCPRSECGAIWPPEQPKPVAVQASQPRPPFVPSAVAPVAQQRPTDAGITSSTLIDAARIRLNAIEQELRRLEDLRHEASVLKRMLQAVDEVAAFDSQVLTVAN